MLKMVVRALLLGVVCFIAIGIHLGKNEQVALNKPAIDAGFTDKADMDIARAAGFTEAPLWRQEQTRREALAKIQRDAEFERKYEATRDPSTKMTMPAMTWSVGGFGSIGLVTVTIQNDNDFPVKDIRISCRFSGNSGTKLSEVNHTIFDTIKAKSRRTFKEVNVGFINSQSAKAGCNVETALRV